MTQREETVSDLGSYSVQVRMGGTSLVYQLVELSVSDVLAKTTELLRREGIAMEPAPIGPYLQLEVRRHQ